MLAVQWEILDPGEVRYVLTRSEDFASDLKLLRRRYHELAGQAWDTTRDARCDCSSVSA